MIRIDFVDIFISGPQILFPYDYFEWITPLPSSMMNLLLLVLAACCVMIMLGVFYRYAMAVFCVGFTYIFLLDKAYYNNHLYLMCLLALLLTFIWADRALVFRKKTTDPMIPRWMLLVLQLQLIVVYFYGGIAKMNPDWLFEQQPVIPILAAKGIHNGFLIAFVTYGGLLFDLFVGVFLFIKKTRPYAIAAAIFFNISNAWIFNDINIFPYFMLASLFLFVEPEWIRKTLAKFGGNTKKGKKGKNKATEANIGPFGVNKTVVLLLTLYFAIQVLMPFRHWLIPGNVDWTGEAQRFSWRMKIQHRSFQLTDIQFLIRDFDKKQQIPVGEKVLNAFGINRDQRVQMAHDPMMVARFARFLAEDHKQRTGARRVEVLANIPVGFNGRTPQSTVDSEADLATAKVGFMQHAEWIPALKE